MDPSKPSSDRRQNERKPLRTTSYLRLPGSRPTAVRSVDISLGGMSIIATANPPSKTSCVLRVGLPAGAQGIKLVEVEAKVLHSVFSGREDGFKVGLSFVNLGAEARQAISSYLSSVR
ncbi:PilZ domain-containing protein [Niveibacterium sp. 24ML]|uniref:PilZ domain-containing protein n=1 Tax=Niveibacterium sp. 24ML TaxID=2985512 RepID=UPI00226E5617|nr:PilZ domain-containing protein [Niveibacterium sp. 24ML]MCX9157363.1 PilZ domain-containing protein [Niveibacterium sp. 24ML]